MQKDFQPKVIKKDKEGYYIIIKGKIYQELSILNIYAPNARAPTFIKETLLKLKAHIAPHTIVVGNFNTILINGQIMETQTKQRHSETNRSYGPNGLTDIYRTFHPKTKKYTLFSAPPGTFSKTDHIIGYKKGLNR